MTKNERFETTVTETLENIQNLLILKGKEYIFLSIK